MVAKISELEKFRVAAHKEVTSQGIMLKENVAKTCEFIDLTTMHTYAKNINEYENGKLTVAQQENINAILNS